MIAAGARLPKGSLAGTRVLARIAKACWRIRVARAIERPVTGLQDGIGDLGIGEFGAFIGHRSKHEQDRATTIGVHVIQSRMNCKQMVDAVGKNCRHHQSCPILPSDQGLVSDAVRLVGGGTQAAVL